MNLKSMLYWLVVALCVSWKVLMLSLKETPFQPFSEVWEIVLILGDWLIRGEGAGCLVTWVLFFIMCYVRRMFWQICSLRKGCFVLLYLLMYSLF